MQSLNISVLESFPKVDEELVDKLLAGALKRLNRKIVVLDDDPTGIQTVHSVPVYTSWDMKAVRAGLAEESPMFFLMTNSRGMPEAETACVHSEIGETLCAAARETGQDYIVISRGDSTMRGHFPLETDTFRKSVEKHSDKRFDGEIFCPFFKEGGRFTIGDVHYVREGNVLTPAGETEFARDKTFAYKSSHIGEYIEEKTKGGYTRESCVYISLDDLRNVNVSGIKEQLMAVDGFRKVIINAVDYIDLKVFSIAFADAVLAGKEFIIRSAASIIKVLGGIPDRPLLGKADLIDPANKNGGIVLVGSHVNRTTMQLEGLRKCAKPVEFIEFNQHLVVTDGGLAPEVDRVVALAEKHIKSGQNVAVFTRRDRFDVEAGDREAQLRVAVEISDALKNVIGRLTVRPNFIITKGGITSSDVGTKALGVRRAWAMGQVKPGVPVWRTGDESKFPGMPFVIFPGNVGEEGTLREVVDELS